MTNATERKLSSSPFPRRRTSPTVRCGNTREVSVAAAIFRVAFVLACLLVAGAGAAHEIRPAVITVTFGAPTYDIEISGNIEAMLAGVGPNVADTSESPNAQRYDALRLFAPAALDAEIRRFAPDLIRKLAVEFDGQRATPELVDAKVPDVGDSKLARISVVHLRGQVPPGAREFRWSMNRGLGDNVLRLREAGREQMASVWLKNGDWSDPYVIGQGLRQRSTLEVGLQYIGLGFTHIVPKGLDHILFVLGLYLLSTKWKPLLVQVTSFTIAHSITLGLSMYGVLSLPSSIVEPLIALSIAYVAIENVLTSELHAWRPVVVFGFGLLHGMGFAGVLQEIGMPRSEFVTALVAFNVGVELGQLAVITGAFVLTGIWMRNKAWYRGWFVVPASVAIAATGLYWTVERVLG